MKHTLLLTFTLVAIMTVKEVYGKDCFDARSNHTWAPETMYTPLGECVILRCTDNGFSIYGKTCDAVNTVDCEIIPVDLTKTYPDCCERCKE